MKTAGIIAEYNPFHNGHAYHIAQTRSLGCTHIIAVMSGNIVQRGDIAILDAHSRAEMAVKGGADLVIELPPPYSAGSARDFARAGVHILKCLGVAEALSFGSECGDIETLKDCAAALSSDINEEITAHIAAGKTYPQAIAALFPRFAHILQGANNTLAIEYIQALSGSGITPLTVSRTAHHDSGETCGSFASASKIRELILRDKSVENLMPFSFDSKDVSKITEAKGAILFRLAEMSADEIKNAPYTGDGIAERLIRSRMTAGCLTELYEAVKTRNVTLARVRRAVLLAALGASQSDLSQPPYARVLAANRRGLEILAECKKRASIPISASLAELAKTSPYAKRCAELTELSAKLRWMARCGRSERFVSEYSRRFVVSE